MGDDAKQPQVAALDHENRAWSFTKKAAFSVYQFLDRLSEGVASALGLNDSKFQWEIDEHNRIQEQRRADDEPLDLEECYIKMKGQLTSIAVLDLNRTPRRSPQHRSCHIRSHGPLNEAFILLSPRHVSSTPALLERNILILAEQDDRSLSLRTFPRGFDYFFSSAAPYVYQTSTPFTLASRSALLACRFEAATREMCGRAIWTAKLPSISRCSLLARRTMWLRSIRSRRHHNLYIHTTMNTTRACQGEKIRSIKRRKTQAETLRSLKAVQTQFMMGLNQTFKRLRREETRPMVLAQYYRSLPHAAFPYEAVRPTIACRPVYVASTTVQTTIPLLPSTQSQSSRVSIQNLLT
ncbi:hypothetical protein PROFUN_07440 [Planoprotostelium fungivorum]|uniref:Uncharacterized protein n=1 Tax=Planoprotostelium fungivorum TaxID=1890364 RepID=A0A2P6NLG3_9EUKA|nr:hypothetical protein PROFUN_07440 [Planoprotostelium fungivorum]